MMYVFPHFVAASKICNAAASVGKQVANSSIGQTVATDAAIVGKGAMIAGGAVAGAGWAAGNVIANDNYLDGKWSVDSWTA